MSSHTLPAVGFRMERAYSRMFSHPGKYLLQGIGRSGGIVAEKPAFLGE